jgi:F-type H+-transporting ATPase subunit a
VHGPMVLLIFPLEVLSNLMRIISLSVRLFANMLAGHLIILFMAGGLAILLGTAAVGVFLLPLGWAIYLFEVGLVATLLIFIWVLNMVGFVPLPLSDDKFHLAGLAIPTFGVYAATASLSVTLALSLMTWIFTHVEGVRFNGVFGYLKSIIPEVPRGILPFIAIIEFISVFMRLISLSVRLFANMLAGHMLILVMIGLIFVIHTPPWRFFGLPAAILFYLFEVIIVVSIQAFIFAALSAIYIGSAIEPEH